MNLFPKKRLRVYPEALRALRHRNYKIFISGQIVSLVGSWFQNTAMGWLIYHVITQSSFSLGLLHFALQIPVLALGLVAGAVADSVNRHKLLILTQFLFMSEAILLAVLTLIRNDDGYPLLTLEIALCIAVFTGIVQAFDLPARQSFLQEMVPREDLQNAIAINSLTFNGARIIGPAIAGALIAYFHRHFPEKHGFGEGICFVINATTFTAVIFSLFRMNVTPPVLQKKDGSNLQYVVDGIRFVRKHIHLTGLMSHLAVMALFGIPYLMIIPVYAKEVLGGEADVYGSLITAVGIGAVCGGSVMAMRKSVKGLGSHMAASAGGFTLFLLLLSFISYYYLAILLFACAGFCMVMTMISNQTLIQTLVPGHLRGRVMSIYSMLSIGLLPFGSLLSGFISEHFGVRWAFIFNASAIGLATLFFTIKIPKLRNAALQTEEYRSAIGLIKKEQDTETP